MGSYHSSFEYLVKEIDENGKEIKLNSFKDYKLLITSFEPEDGFTDTFLSTDNISDDYYDGTKKFNYGVRYNTSAEIQITLIKSNKSDFSLKEFRECAKWLTGAKIDSWLDMYVGDKFVYAFLGKFTNLEHYKLDGRIVGIKATFSSVSPWAWSEPIEVDWDIDQIMQLTEDGILIHGEEDNGEEDKSFAIDENGILYIPNSTFQIEPDGTLYLDASTTQDIDNKSDDLYTYIYLDIDYINENGDEVKIENVTLGEKTEIYNVQPKEIISISSKQFIRSKTELGRIFGDDFNFVWPRMAPGLNTFIVSGSGTGSVKFTYRYPMKVGDCAMDITVYGGDDGGCDNIASYDTIKWEDITGKPNTIGGYGITDAYTKGEVYNKDEVYNKNETYSQDDVYTKNDVYNKNETYSTDNVYTKEEVDEKIENIEVTGGSGGSVTIDEQELNDMLADILG